MKIVHDSKPGAQGDIIFYRIDEIPSDAKEMRPEKGRYIIAHSETGHHHTIGANNLRVFEAANDPFVMYLAVDNDVELKHERNFDTHESWQFKKGFYKIYRQGQEAPEGWRYIID